MTKTYTLIAYRRDGYDSCKGHSSSSMLKISIHADPAALIAMAGKLAFDNTMEERTNYSIKSIEFTILIDGQERDAYCVADNWDTADAIDEIEEHIRQEAQRLLQAEQDRQAEELRKRKLTEAAAAELQREEADAAEIDLLHSLIAKHGIPQTQDQE